MCGVEPADRRFERAVLGEVRKGGRAVECTGLENRQGRKSLVSSNLTLSANINNVLSTYDYR